MRRHTRFTLLAVLAALMGGLAMPVSADSPEPLAKGQFGVVGFRDRLTIFINGERVLDKNYAENANEAPFNGFFWSPVKTCNDIVVVRNSDSYSDKICFDDDVRSVEIKNGNPVTITRLKHYQGID